MILRVNRSLPLIFSLILGCSRKVFMLRNVHIPNRWWKVESHDFDKKANVPE